jgi:hypothetical protein
MLLSHGFAFIFKDNLRLRPLFKKPYDLLKLAARHKVSADIPKPIRLYVKISGT